MKLKVATILGTRPEIIRLSRVMALLNECTDHLIIHTGQNYDYELNEVFFTDLDVTKPSYFLGVDTSSLGATVGGILLETEKVLAKEKPDAVLILGDTNSAISSYIARRMKIPIYHMEAGNRCFDRNVPEETNRKMVDHLADFNLVYTEHARRNLLSEGLHPRRIYLTGSPMREVLNFYLEGIDRSNILTELSLEADKYFLVSIHREENVDNSENLTELVTALNRIADLFDLPVVVSTHPRTRKRLDMLTDVTTDERVHWLKPFGFYDYNRLQKSAKCVVSDSGTIAEESSMLGFSAVTPRFSIERPEAIDTGAIMACGYKAADIIRCISATLNQKSAHPTGYASFVPVDYQITNTAQRVVNLILATAKLSNEWDGIRSSE